MKLPLNCNVEYLANFLNPSDAKELLAELTDLVKKTTYLPQTQEGKIFHVNFGKMMFLDPHFIEENKFPEHIWGPTRIWTDKLKVLKEKVEGVTHQKFQVGVLIYYPDGTSGVDFHSDYTAYGDTSIIPSLSLGEVREFRFREKKSKIELSQMLENGSLIIMGAGCQDKYEHSLPLNPKYKKPRINLTFRKYGFDN